MSHVVSIAGEMKSIPSIKKACARLGWECVENSSCVYYDGREVHGTVVTVPNWRYGATIQQDGTVATDTYGSAWGNEDDLKKLTQYYGLEEAKAQFSLHGMYSFETVEEDGSISLTVDVTE